MARAAGLGHVSRIDGRAGVVVSLDGVFAVAIGACGNVFIALGEQLSVDTRLVGLGKLLVALRAGLRQLVAVDVGFLL